MGSNFHRVEFASRVAGFRTVRALFVVLSALALAAGTACRSESEDTSLTPEGFCQRSAEASCGNLAACCSLSKADCVMKYEAGCLESTYNAINRGMVFKKEAAARCVQSSQGAYEGCLVPTADGTTRAGPCGLVLEGSVQSGFGCTFDGACRSENGLTGVCRNEVCAQVPLLSLGAACRAPEDGVCPPDSYCETTCQRVRASGDHCATAVECASGRCESGACATIPLADVCAALADVK